MSTKRKSLMKNYLYNLSYQLVLILSPLIVTPYITRILGPIETGKYSFTFSIVSIFVLFASLGFNIYGQRLIASQQSKRDQQRKSFFEIIICKLVIFVIIIIVYFIPIISKIYESKYLLLFSVETLELFNVLFDISFLFQGNEDFGVIAVRSIAVRTIGIVLIFTLVKSAEDTITYAIIQSGTVLMGSLSLWLYLPKELEKSKSKIERPFRHLPQALRLFLPTIAVSIYTLLDKTLIGVITKSDFQVGNYEYAEKLVRILLTIVASLGIILISRNSALYEEERKNELNQNVFLSFDIVVHFAFPMMFGVIVIASRFSLWFLGDEFSLAGNIMKILSPIIVLIGVSNILGQQYLIPTRQDKKYTVAILAGSVSNIIINIPLIYYWGAFGAAASTSISELIVCIIMYLFVRKDLGDMFVLKAIKPVIAGVIMLFCGLLLDYYLPSETIWVFVVTLLCVILYFSILLIMKDSFLKKALQLIKERIIKRKSKA